MRTVLESRNSRILAGRCPPHVAALRHPAAPRQRFHGHTKASRRLGEIECLRSLLSVDADGRSARRSAVRAERARNATRRRGPGEHQSHSDMGPRDDDTRPVRRNRLFLVLLVLEAFALGVQSERHGWLHGGRHMSRPTSNAPSSRSGRPGRTSTRITPIRAASTTNGMRTARSAACWPRWATSATPRT